MKQMTEAELRELLNDAWEQGFTESMMYGGVAAGDKEAERDRDVAEIMESV